MSEPLPTQLRQNGAIRFDVLARLLPRGVEPSDIDQVIENDGSFLFIEFKRPGQTMPTGQRILFNRLSRLPDCEVLIVIGQPPAEIQSYGWLGEPQQPADAQDLRTFVRMWWDSKEKP